MQGLIPETSNFLKQRFFETIGCFFLGFCFDFPIIIRIREPGISDAPCCFSRAYEIIPVI